jgi:hypothetical protein
MSMPALSLWQPWASLCVLPRPCSCPSDHPGLSAHFHRHGCREGEPFKTIETRSWAAPRSLIGQRFAIHAAKTARPLTQLFKSEFFARDEAAHAVLEPFRQAGIDAKALPFGAVVGTTRLADCIPMIGEYELADGPYLRANPQPLGLLLRARDDSVQIVEGQRPFGWFEAGRSAWILDDAEAFDQPIPAIGRQGIWRWEQP